MVFGWTGLSPLEARRRKEGSGPSRIETAPRPTPTGSVLGKIHNARNKALGLGLGLAGHMAAKVQGGHPRIAFGENAIEFMGNPVGGVSAITLGNTTIYHDDPYEPGNPATRAYIERDGYPPWKHETSHTYQGEQLGGLYLPSNILGGLKALVLDRDEEGHPDWHGDHNWNEVGPLTKGASRPWPSRKPR